MSRERNTRTSMRDRVRQRAEENKHRGGSNYLHLPEGVKFFPLDKGTHDLDILPYEVTTKHHPEADPGELWYRTTFFVHRGIGAEEKRYICPRSVKKPCPICDHRATMMKDPHADEEAIKALKPQEKDLFNIDCGKDGIQILEFSRAMFGRILEEEINEGRDEWGGFADLEGGFTLSARFSEETFGKSKFLKCTRIDFNQRKDYPESILDKVVNLDEILHVLPYDKLEKIFLEVDGDDNEEPEERRNEDRRGRRDSESRESEREIQDERPSRRRGPEPEPEKEPVREERTSRRNRPEPEPEKDPEPEKPKRERQRPEPKKEDGPTCPHGGKWAKDCDKLDACFTCDVWDACRDAADGLK